MSNSVDLLQARLIIDPAQRGSWNMAVDQALLERAGAGQPVVFRIYEWAPATLSLGYFQKLSDRQRHAPSLSCPVVRRSTGGGAIVHDREITYSLVLGNQHLLSSTHLELYRLVHEGITASLRALGVPDCRIYGQSDEPERKGSQADNEHSSDPTSRSPFLCFQRRSHGDIVLRADKIVGSAQRRIDGALLQHGSVLLGRSSYAPELPGVEDLADVAIDRQAFLDRWLLELANQLNVTFSSAPITDEELSRAREIEQTRFAHFRWTEKR